MKFGQYLHSAVHNLWDPFNAETSLFDFREKHSKQLKFDFWALWQTFRYAISIYKLFGQPSYMI